MSQFKNNQVKNPSFATRTTTPQMRGAMDTQTVRAAGGFAGATPFNMSYIPGPQSKVPPKAPNSGVAFPAFSALGVTPGASPTKPPLLPGTNNYTPMSIQALTGNRPQPTQQTGSPAFPQTGETSGSTPNSAQSQLDGLKTQALGIQDLLNQKIANESRSQNNNQGSNNTFAGILDTLLGKSNPSKEQERARKEMERISVLVIKIL
jgi:hypothetical protein